MKTVAITGATGFIGRHVVSFLRGSGIVRVVASGRNEEKLQRLGVDYAVHDIKVERDDVYHLLGDPDILIHLAWQDLPNYNGLFHFEENLTAGYRFLKRMIQGGLSSLTVAGTCYEYGLQSGCLTEEAMPHPTTCYGIAKDALRRFLEMLRTDYPFRFRWGRFFFLYGEGQHRKALIPQLEKAISDGARSFAMSGGEQLRDYLPVEEAAKLLAAVSLQNRFDGIFNICSGKPVSVRRLAEQWAAARGSDIRLDLGVFPYPEHEPMAYWGDAVRLRQAVNEFGSDYKFLKEQA